MERRFVSSRSNSLIQAAARALARTSVTPNQISVFCAVAAAGVPLGLQGLPGAFSLMGTLLALAAIQLRLLANVLDGLVAVEGGKSSTLGALYNEFPDRIADTVILVAVGYASGMAELGWVCALLAALTAYVRAFGGALGLPQSFIGPMAKQHRMAVVSLALAITAVLRSALAPSLPVSTAQVLQSALWVIALGSATTCWTRTRAIVSQLEKKARDAKS